MWRKIDHVYILNVTVPLGVLARKQQENTSTIGRIYSMSFWGIFLILGLLTFVIVVTRQLLALRTIKPKTIHQNLMNEFGNTTEERREKISALFARQTGALSTLFDIFFAPHRMRVFLERNLTTIEPLEKFALETAYHLYNENCITDENFNLMRMGLFYADGRGLDVKYSEYMGKKFKPISLGANDMRDLITNKYGMDSNRAITHALNRLEGAYKQHPDNPIIKDLYQRYDQSQGIGEGQFNVEENVTQGDKRE